MKHLIPDEIMSTAELIPLIRKPATPGERLEMWAKALERHAGPLNAPRRLEHLSPDELRAYRGSNTPLTVAFNDPMLRAEGLKGDSLGDAMEFFDLSHRMTHWMLCDCHYHGTDDRSRPRQAASPACARRGTAGEMGADLQKAGWLGSLEGTALRSIRSRPRLWPAWSVVALDRQEAPPPGERRTGYSASATTDWLLAQLRHWRSLPLKTLRSILPFTPCDRPEPEYCQNSHLRPG